MEEQQQALEERRAEAERELAEQRAQDEALQAYLTQMSTLLLEKDLRESKEDSEVRILARARTLTALKRLDSERNSDILQFLGEAQLISRTDPVISFNHSNLRGADLSNADLSETNLFGADMGDGAILSNADLIDANLGEADLSNAYLFQADLSDADLSGADLSNARLYRADLRGAEVITNEGLDQQAYSLEGATMPNGQRYEDWRKSKNRAEDG
jgi:uncharacterized protein YjbI with pentapeptide repeats